MIDNTVYVNVPRKKAFKKLPFLWSKQGFTFDMFMWSLMSDYLCLPISDFGVLEDKRFIVVAYYSAARSYNLQSGKKVNFDEDDVKYWFQAMPQSDANAIWAKLLLSRVGGESLVNLILDNFNKEEEKKN